MRRLTVMVVMMMMRERKRFPIGHPGEATQEGEFKDKKAPEPPPDTNTHKQTFISKYVCV